MFDVDQIRGDHKDVIHDVAYDYYGKRMATCSSDQTIKVWDLDEHDKWTESASWKAHSGSIWRVSWAHPEFGQVLATCSFDRTASVWEEILCDKPTPAMTPAKRWARRTTLVDSRTSVTDVKFAPKFLGLLLATASADGIIRIYEAPDIMNLSQWPVQHEIECKLPLSCLSWNQSMYMLHAPLIAVGSDDTTTSGGKVIIFEYSEHARKWAKIETINSITEPVHDLVFAPNVGRSYHVLAVASKDLQILNLKPTNESTNTTNRIEVQTVAQFNDHQCQVWRVCWNITGTMLASSGDDGCVRIWRMNYLLNWKCATVLNAEGCQPPIEIPNSKATGNQSFNNLSQTILTTKYYKRGTISNTDVPRH